MTRTDFDADEMRVLALVLDDGRRFDDLERRGGRSLFASKHARTVFDAVVQCRDRHGRVIREVVYGILRSDAGPVEAQILMDHLINEAALDRKSTRLNSSHVKISYAVFCLKKKKTR